MSDFGADPDPDPRTRTSDKWIRLRIRIQFWIRLLTSIFSYFKDVKKLFFVIFFLKTYPQAHHLFLFFAKICVKILPILKA